MALKRKLADLYLVGREVILNDDSGGDPVKVYIRKLNPVEQETALRKANAKRAQALIGCDDMNSEDFQDAYSQVVDMGREKAIELCIAEEIGKISASVEAEISAEEHWSNDNFLQGLQDAWVDGLSEKFALDPEDSEASRVFLALQQFTEEVSGEVDARVMVLRDSWERKSDQAVYGQAAQQLIRFTADSDWMREYRKCQIWLSVKDPDTKKPYFGSRSEVDELPVEVQSRLIAEYLQMDVDVTEGKDSPESTTSSDS